MKKIVLALFCVAVAAFADDPPQTPAAAAPKDDLAKLVEASKAARAARQKSGTKKSKVITNADVKKSRGKLETYVPKELPAGSEVTVTLSMMEQHQLNLRERKTAEERATVAGKRVTELQKDLNALELSFYEENDPNYRDGVIQQRFAQTKRQLEEARTELADARDALAALDQKSGPQPEVIEAQAPPQP